MPLAWLYRPARIEKSWRGSGGHEEAKKRAMSAQRSGLPLPEPEDDTGPAVADLFGQPIEKGRPVDQVKRRKVNVSQHRGVTGHKELTQYWCGQWKQTEGRGREYPYSAQDGALIKHLIERTDSIDHAKAVIDAYLKCRDKFYRGKALRRLIGDLPRFIVEADGGHRKNTLASETDDILAIPDLTRDL
jgi:hypothetical protein